MSASGEQFCTDFAEWSLLVKHIESHFARHGNHHGVRSGRLLLWGVTGTGKTQIAIQAAQQIVQSDGRKLILIHADSTTAFISAYRRAYTSITGKSIGQSHDSRLILTQVQRLLEERRKEIFTVVVDCYEDMDIIPAIGDQPMVNYLPRFGQILFTSSILFRNLWGITRDLNTLGLYADTVFHVWIPEWYDCALPMSQSDNSSRAMKMLCGQTYDMRRFWRNEVNYPLFESLTEATIRLSQMSDHQHCKALLAGVRSNVVDRRHGGSAYHCAMTMLWDSISDHSTWASYLLAALSVVGRHNIPVTLLGGLHIFRQSLDDQLSPATELLISLGIITVHSLDDSSTVINIPRAIHNWIQARVRADLEEEEYEDLLVSWVQVIDDYIGSDNDVDDDEDAIASLEQALPSRPYMLAQDFLAGEIREEKQRQRLEQACSILPHVQTLVEKISSATLVSSSVAVFLTKLARLFANDKDSSNQCVNLIDQAFNIYNRSTPGDCTDQDVLRLLEMRILRAQAFLGLSRPLDAQNDFFDANAAYHTLPITGETIRLRPKLLDLEVMILLQQERDLEIEQLLSGRILLPERALTAEMQARRRYWLAGALKELDRPDAALAHSHEAMGYWASLPDEYKWSPRKWFLGFWVLKHGELLMSKNKYKGALLFLPKLLDVWVENLPSYPVRAWRVACYNVRCHAWLRKLAEADAVAQRMIELSPLEGLFGEGLTYALLLLYALATACNLVGRVSEAEHILCFNIWLADKRNAMGRGGTEYQANMLNWELLMVCKLQQGKSIEYVKAKYQEEHSDIEELLETVRKNMQVETDLVNLYNEAWEAEYLGNQVEFRALLSSQEKDLLAAAEDKFGPVRERVFWGYRLSEDLDLYRVEEAMKSRIVRLLNFAMWEILPRSRPIHLEEYYMLFPPPGEKLQRTLRHYWRTCDCDRRRMRSVSVNGFQRLEKRHLKMKSDEEIKPRDPKQQLITAWISIEPRLRSIAKECSEQCPCRAANEQGPVEFGRMESSLWTLKDPGRAANKKPFKVAQFKKGKGGDWYWPQAEFNLGDSEDENYLLAGVYATPIITISTEDGSAPYLGHKKRRAKQSKIVDYFGADSDQKTSEKTTEA